MSPPEDGGTLSAARGFVPEVAGPALISRIGVFGLPTYRLQADETLAPDEMPPLPPAPVAPRSHRCRRAAALDDASQAARKHVDPLVSAREIAARADGRRPGLRVILPPALLRHRA